MELHEVIGPDEIRDTVKRLASEIARDHMGKNPVLVGVMKGSFIFLADLARELSMPVELDFIRAKSYGPGTESSGSVRILHDIEADIRGRDVIVVEDIVDTALTLGSVVRHLREKGPARISICALLDKPSRRRVDCRLDYVGMEVKDAFLVGYGLDLSEAHRNLPGIHELR